MTTSIRFLGVAGYEINCPSGRILIDPFLTGNPMAPAPPAAFAQTDLILVSHGAFDHYGDAAEIALLSHAPVICGADVKTALLECGVPASQIRATIWGIGLKLGDVLIRSVECRHWSHRTLADGSHISGVPLAFIIEPEPDVRIYHYGDSAIFDMELIGTLYRPTVAIIGCTQPWELAADQDEPGELLSGEMTPDEAARVAEMLRAPLVMASHYLRADTDVDEFLNLVPLYDSSGTRRAIAPAVGESIELSALHAGAASR